MSVLTPQGRAEADTYRLPVVRPTFVRRARRRRQRRRAVLAVLVGVVAVGGVLLGAGGAPTSGAARAGGTLNAAYPAVPTFDDPPPVTAAPEVAAPATPRSRPEKVAKKAAKQATKQVAYADCAAVRAAGAAPIRRGQPGYSRKLDPDRDGIACR